MVDSVGGKPTSIGELSVARVSRTAPVRPADAPERTTAAAPAAGLRQVAAELASAPPVDFDRVARIRRAIAEGRFPLSPATIADHLIALRLDWNGNDQA